MRTTGKATDLITFSRSSGGTALRKIGYGSELVTNGTFDTDLTGWTEQSGGSVFTVSSGQLTISRSAIDPGYVYQTIDTTVGSIYSLTFDIIDDGPIDLRVGNSPAGLQITSSGIKSSAGTYTLLFVATGATAYISAVNTSYSTDATIDNISVKEVLFDQGDLTLFNHPADIPRIEYDANGNVLGLLVEEARVNLFPNSEAIDVTLNSQQQVSVSDVSITEGVYQGTWRNITEDTSTNQHRLVSGGSINITPNVSYTFSALVKRTSGLRDVQFTLFNSGDSVVGNFSLSNETATTESTGSATAQSADIENLGNGVYLVSVTGIVSTTATSCFELVRLTDDGTETYTGDGTSSVAITAMQLEQGSFKTSYIPTSGSTATRAADVASITTSEFGYNEKLIGTFVVEWIAPSDRDGRALSITSILGTANRFGDVLGTYVGNDVDIYSNHTAGDLYGNAPYNIGSVNKVAFTMGENDSASCANGGTVKTDTATGTPVSAAYINFGAYGGVYLNSHIKKLTYIPRRLTNDQLVEITS